MSDPGAQPPKPLLSRIGNAAERAVVSALPARLGNLLQMSRFGLWNRYFDGAEQAIDWQWDTMIWPLIQEFDFESTLELAPGAGRNTEKLAALAKRIYAVDYAGYALRRCKKRLGERRGDCVISYHRNNGRDLRMIPDAAVSALYCWDSAVHFERSVMEGYVAEFARVLRPGGKGFIHHSNLGDAADKNIKKNPHWRSGISKELFAQMCEANSLRILAQADLPWDGIVDCRSVFEKPAANG